MNGLTMWLKAATPAEQMELAKEVGTSRAYLNHLGAGHRKASAAIAGQIEMYTEVMHRASEGRLPRVYRTDLADVCRQCRYARECLGTIVDSVMVEDVDA